MTAKRIKDGHAGMTLLELLIAMSLTAVLLLGLVQLVTAAGSATQLQDNQASLQDRERYLANLFFAAAANAAYSPEPWNQAQARSAIAQETADGVSANGDRLVLSTWSDLNCFDNRNPVLDTEGRPRFFIRETTFELNSSDHLALTCRYGPSDSELVTQIRRQGLVPGVESFQCLFGEDSDADGNVDRWVKAGRWQGPQKVMGVRIGLLVAGDDAVSTARMKNYRVLDSTLEGRPDGKLRQVIDLTLAIRSQSG